MVCIFWGRDRFSLGEAIAELKKGMGEPSWVEANTTLLEGRFSLPALEDALQSTPFFLPRRLVIARGLLSRFNPRKDRSGEGRPSEDPQPWLRAIRAMPESTILMMVEEQIEPNNPLVAALRGVAEVRAFLPRRGASLHNWIMERAARGGGKLTLAAARLLADTAGEDLGVLAGEVEKLLLYAGEETVTEEMVLKVATSAAEVRYYYLSQDLLGGRAGRAARDIHRLLEEGIPAPAILRRLGENLRTLVEAKELLSEGAKPEAVGEKLGISHPYRLKQTVAQAQGTPQSRIEEVYRWLLRTDLAIKTGQWEEGLALDFLVAGLCQGKPPPKG